MTGHIHLLIDKMSDQYERRVLAEFDHHHLLLLILATENGREGEKERTNEREEKHLFFSNRLRRVECT